MENDKMSKGVISVELRLALDTLQAQATKAAKTLGLKLSTTGATAIAGETDKAATAQDKLSKSVDKTTSSLKQQLAEWRKLNVGGVAPGQKITIASGNTNKATTGNPFQGQAGGNTGAGLALPQPNFMPPHRPQPTVPVIAVQPKVATPPVKPPAPPQPPALPSGPSPGGIGGLSKMLLPIGQILATAELVKRALANLIEPLMRFAAMLEKAYQSGVALYAKATTSGMGSGMTAKLGVLSSVLGVSENEVLQFGRQIQYLGDRAQWATQVLTTTLPSVTAVGWEINLLKENFSALEAEIADAAAPVVMAFVDDISDMIKAISNSGAIKEWVDILSRVAAVVVVVVAAVASAIGGFIVGLQLIWDALQKFIGDTINTVMWLASKLHIISKDTYEKNKFDTDSLMKPGVDSAKALGAFMDSAGKMAGDLWNGSDNKKPAAPPPQAFMKQMPTSQWERMGLAIGGSGGTNYAKSTADNTKAANTLLQHILAAAQSQGKFTINQPTGLPSMP